MKNVNDRTLGAIIIIMALVLAFFVRESCAQQYEYKGVYTLKTVFTNYCENCYLELPPDYLNSEVVLSVSTDDSTKLFKALQTSSKALGWNLSRGQRGQFKAEPIENVGMLVYISCMDNQPKNVPKYLYTASIESEGSLTITGAEGCTLKIVTVTGNVVMNKRIDSPEQKIELNIPKGCYIVKVGKVVRRVYVR